MSYAKSSDSTYGKKRKVIGQSALNIHGGRVFGLCVGSKAPNFPGRYVNNEADARVVSRILTRIPSKDNPVIRPVTDRNEWRSFLNEFFDSKPELIGSLLDEALDKYVEVQLAPIFKAPTTAKEVEEYADLEGGIVLTEYWGSNDKPYRYYKKSEGGKQADSTTPLAFETDPDKANKRTGHWVVVTSVKNRADLRKLPIFG